MGHEGFGVEARHHHRHGDAQSGPPLIRQRGIHAMSTRIDPSLFAPANMPPIVDRPSERVARHAPCRPVQRDSAMLTPQVSGALVDLVTRVRSTHRVQRQPPRGRSVAPVRNDLITSPDWVCGAWTAVAHLSKHAPMFSCRRGRAHRGDRTISQDSIAPGFAVPVLSNAFGSCGAGCFLPMLNSSPAVHSATPCDAFHQSFRFDGVRHMRLRPVRHDRGGDRSSLPSSDAAPRPGD